MLGGAIALATLGGDVKKTALKLHRQFGHPTSAKLIKLVTDAGIRNSELERAIKDVSDVCTVCCRFKKARPRPVVSLPMASRFNEAVAMDLKAWGRHYFLVLVDLATRFCTATVIGDKSAATIIKGVFRSWIGVFGAPKKFLSDNGCEFNNAEMRELGEAFNIKIMTTSAESPWSNGACERQNAVIGDIVRKIMADSRCDLDVALAWAVSARNALTNYAGFSPNQLVFGQNPGLPNVCENDPPALNPTLTSDIVRVNLNALHLARQEFVKTESSERLSRALRHNIRSSDLNDIQNGDEVFYKRNDSHEWHGPGVVIGRDGKQILVRHGSVYVRVHVCRLTHAPERNIAFGSNENIEGVSSGGNDEVQDKPNDDQDDDSENGEIPVVQSHDEQPQVEQPSNSGNLVEQPPKVSIGQRIKGIHSVSGELISGKIVSRAGKATGKYRHCYNLKKDSDGDIGWVDLQNDFSSWEVIDDDMEMLILFNSEDVLCAKDNEITNWQNNNVYEEVEDVGQDAISVRWVVTEKMKSGRPIVKARLVARGFEEDTVSLRKDSPTCSKEAVRLALSLASTNQWDCHVMDVKAAYLQGHDIERVVHLRPPPEYANGKLWRLKKTVYGLCDAARHWYLRVKDQLLDLGAEVSSLDSALFSWSNKGKLGGFVCVYVDDFLWAGTHEFQQKVINRLSQIFLVGSSESKNFKYVGLNVVSNTDGSITLDQFQYASSMKPVTLSKHRTAVKSGELSESEKTEYRALIGQLNWIATHTRPDIAFDVCELSVNSNRATIADLLRLNKVIARVKTDNMKLYIPRMEPLECCYMECFSDASFANLVGNGSQGGMVIFLRDAGEARCPIFWQTRKIRRVVKSTLSAEALALLECAEAAVYLANILHEVSGCGKLKIKCFVDNKSLVDALYSCKNVEDRRLRINIAVL